MYYHKHLFYFHLLDYHGKIPPIHDPLYSGHLHIAFMKTNGARNREVPLYHFLTYLPVNSRRMRTGQDLIQQEAAS